jgi:hypothetical protein
MLAIGIAYAVYALSLLIQPARWSRTPAYHLILAVMPAPWWGLCFAVASAGLIIAVAAFRRRWLTVAALTAAGVITLAWAFAFIVRWATSGSTTPETWVSWSINAYLLTRAGVLLDYHPGPGPGPGPGPRPSRRGAGDGSA